MATRKNTAAMHTTAQPQHHDSDIFHILLGDGARHDHVVEDTEYEFFNVLKTAERGANSIVQSTQQLETMKNGVQSVPVYIVHEAIGEAMQETEDTASQQEFWRECFNSIKAGMQEEFKNIAKPISHMPFLYEAKYATGEDFGGYTWDLVDRDEWNDFCHALNAKLYPGKNRSTAQTIEGMAVETVQQWGFAQSPAIIVMLWLAEHGALLNTIVHFSNFFKDVQRGDTVFNKFYVVAAFRLHLVATFQQFLHQADALRDMPWNWQSPLYVQEFFDMLKNEHNITTLRRGAALAQSRSGFTKN